MWCNNDRVNVAEEEESADEGVHSLRRHVMKFLLHQCPDGLAEPADAVRNVPNRLP